MSEVLRLQGAHHHVDSSSVADMFNANWILQMGSFDIMATETEVFVLRDMVGSIDTG